MQWSAGVIVAGPLPRILRGCVQDTESRGNEWVVDDTRYVAVTFGAICSKILEDMHSYLNLSHEVLSPIFQGLSR